MQWTLSAIGKNRSRSRYATARWHIENFEKRCVLNASWPADVESAPNDTLDIAEDLGDLLGGQETRRTGLIGDSPAAAADVDWYRFTLGQSSHVTLIAGNQSADVPAGVCVSLYNNAPFTGEVTHDLLGHRLLAQAESNGGIGEVQINGLVGPGTYFVAVSGAGNHSFHPFLVGSGYPGLTGDYELVISSTALDLGIDNGSVVLAADPAPEANLSYSPFVIRLQLSGELDTSTIAPDETVQLIYSSNSEFGDGDEMSVPLMMISFSPEANELQLVPMSPLAPGYYQVLLAGNLAARPAVLTDVNGVPLGQSDLAPQGRDFTYQFQISGIERSTAENSAADDTPATAHELGDVTEAGLVQVSGAIGDDPFYDPSIDWLLNPANDVDLYHFRVSGLSQYVLAAEVFAGRIGSPLDSGVSLFRLDSSDGSLQFVDGNNNTFNPVVANNGTLPLFTDSTLFAGVTSGDYFLAVSSAFNTPSPAEGQLPGSEGIFDPSLSHSGQLGANTGNYLLNLWVQPDTVAPQVTVTTPSAGATLTDSPTHLVVGFSKPVDLQQLAFQAFQQNSHSTLASVFVQAADGTQFHPRLESYDPVTNQATFLMLDGLPSGRYELHLSGLLGLTDLSGNALVGNDSSGDDVTHFEVDSPSRGTVDDPLQWTSQEPNGDQTRPQDLGVLFPNEFQSGITITRGSDDQFDTMDSYQFEVLQRHDYFLSLTGDGLPAGVKISLTDADGNPVRNGTSSDGRTVVASFHPGIYVIGIGSWSLADAASIEYQLHLKLLDSSDNPPPLTVGAAPALQLRLAGATPLPAVPLQVVLSTGPVGDNLGNTAGAGNDRITSGLGNQTNVQVPGTLLLAFGERLVGGVGVTSGVLAPDGEERIALRLPDWFERTGTSDLALLDLPWNAQRFTSQDDDVANDESGDQETPQPREAAAELETPSADGSGTDVSSEEVPESSDLVSPVEQPSSESDDLNGGTSKEAVPSQGVAEEMTEIRIDDSDVLEANFAWLSVIAAVLSGSMRNSEADPRRSGLDGVTFSNGGRFPDTKRAPRRH